MHTNWTLWSRRFLTGLAMVGLVGFTFADTAEVTWNVPDDWTTKTVPTQAEQVDANGSTVELEQNTACRQTLSNRPVNVAVVTNTSSTACEVFGVNNGENSHSTSGSELARDVWLKVSGGSFTNVIGGSRNHWQGSHTTPLSGDIFLEVTGSDTSVSGSVVGAIDKAADSKGVTGNVLVVVSGGSVTGNVIGGVASVHNSTPTIEGNTLVRILSVLSGSNRVLGGSFYGSAGAVNAGSSAIHKGNTAVEVELTDSTSGTFTKEIVGGSYANYDTEYPRNANFYISGDTSVSIKAPNTVTFSSSIYGASYAASDYPITKVGGNSSVTIEGGTYTSGIYAAGYGSGYTGNADYPAPTVTGKATLTLKAGDFSGATIGVGNNGSTAKSSELVIAGTEAIDLSSATVNDDFGALTLQGNLSLGTNRLPSATLSLDGTRTITIKLSDAEKSNNLVTLATADAVPDGLTISATDSAGEAIADWELSEKDGALIYAPHSSSHDWVTPEDGSTDWADGLSGFQNGDNVTFVANSAQETVTLPTNGARVEDLVVNGNYLFDGTTGTLSAASATIGANGTLAMGTGFTFPVKYLRLTPTTPKESGNSIALAELILTKDGTAVAWPTGTTIVQKNTDGSETSPTWGSGGNEAINALIDGLYGSTSYSNGSYTNPSDGSTGTYNGQARNNKWFFSTEGTSAVITLGSAVDFNGYLLYTADHTPRNPKAWTLEGSIDGTTWVTLDERSGITPPDAFSAYNSGTPYETPCTIPYVSGTVFAVAKTLTVNGTLSASNGITAATATFGATGVLAGSPTLTADTITFEEGSTIRVPASGVATLVGEVDGTVAINLEDLLAEKTPTFAEPFAVLKAPTGLTITAPEGYTVAAYSETDGCYQLYRNPPVWHASDTASDNTWSNRACWTGLAEGEAIPTSGAGVDFSATSVATLTIDTSVALSALLVTGSTGGVITVADDVTFSVTTLTVETDLTFPTALFNDNTTITTAGKTITLAGEGSVTFTNPFTKAMALGLTDGANVTLGTDADLSLLTGITIGSGATLDFNGKSYNAIPVTLSGGTIKNSSTTTINVGAVTLTADSSVDTTGGEVDFNSTTSTRKDLVLNGYTLTKTGSNLFKVCGTDLEAGTIYVKGGSLKLDSTGGDTTLKGTRLKFAEGTSYNDGLRPSGTADHWIRSSSSLTLEAEEGASVDFGKAFLTNTNGLTGAVVKEGAGTITVSSGGTIWNGTTTVSGGTLVLNTIGNFTKGSQFTVASGATFKKTGSNTLTLSGNLSGAGTIEVAAGTVTTSAANGGFTGSWTIAESATLSSSADQTWQFVQGGAIEVNGDLVFGGSWNGTRCTSEITGTGKVKFNKSMNVSSAITLTGTVNVAANCTIATSVDNKTLSLSGPNLVCDGTLSGADASITIAKGKTLSGTGTIESAVTLSDGSTLNASTATTNTVLSLSTVTAGGNVFVVLPSTLSSGLKLLGWSAAPEGATYTATTDIPALASLRAKDTGLYYDVMTIDGGTAGSDTDSIKNFSDAVKRTLVEAAFAKDATSITSVTGKQAGEKLTATEIENALTCFALTPSVTVTDGAATITVNYDFGISKFTLGKDGNENPQVVVKAKVQSGENLAQLTSSATMVLQQKSISDSDTDTWTTLEGVSFSRGDDGVYTATVPLSNISNVKFRVLAKTTTTN